MKKIIIITLCSSFVTVMTYCSTKQEERFTEDTRDTVEFGKPAGYDGLSKGEFQEERKELKKEIKEAVDNTKENGEEVKQGAKKEWKEDKKEIKKESREAKKETKEEWEKATN